MIMLLQCYFCLFSPLSGLRSFNSSVVSAKVALHAVVPPLCETLNSSGCKVTVFLQLSEADHPSHVHVHNPVTAFFSAQITAIYCEL
jgi:hypothetical protein